jgi:PucR C-terminal helix-turn-helix domain/GGDEF-like domain
VNNDEYSVWNAGDAAGGVRRRWVCVGVAMTAHSSTSVIESASGTDDPDACASPANVGELSDLTIDEGSLDGLLAAGEFAAEFDENLDEGRSHADGRRLVAEQAVLRRLAMMVARGVGPSAVFGAVAGEMRRCVPAITAGLWRFEADAEITIVAAAADPATYEKWPVDTRIPDEGNNVATSVQRNGQPERTTSADVADHCGAQKRQFLAEASERSNLIDALIEGRAFDEWSLREVAGRLRLPMNGPFVVVAADVPTVGDEPLAEIDSKLRSLDIFSAWRLLPDVQVGIVHMASDRKLGMVVSLLSRLTTARVGVSATFADLRDTPRALHVARVMLRSPTDSTSSIAVFDGSILATAAVSAPAMMIESAGTVLERFSDLPEAEREALFETFRVWQDNDASINVTADRLFCHPNTVRQRLRRIEKHTGRSLSRPRDVAELCLTFEVQRHLM